MPKVYNRARVNTATTGTGTITLGSAVSGYQTFASAGAANSDVVHYTIEEGINWEIGTGTYSSTGPTLTRTLVQSSTGSLLSLTGTAQVFITAPASSIQGGVEITGGTITGLSSAIPVASGGTGVATLTGLAKGNGTSAFSAAVAGTDYVAPAALSAYAPLASPTFTSGINIDNADTTITRSAAGVIAVEGSVVPKENRANTFTASQTLSGAANIDFIISGATATNRGVALQTALSTRWYMYANNTAESGSNAGSNFTLIRYSDAGAFLGTPLAINRATGLTTLESLSVPTIDMGNTDTTITRSAPGVIAVEGGVIPKENRANTFTSEQTVTIDNAPGFKARALSATAYTTVEAQANDYASGPSFTSTFISQYGSTATGTTAGLSRASLGVLSFQNASAGLIGTNGGSPVVFMTTSLERMRIDSSGNVGIGTASPGAKLQVNGSTTVSSQVNVAAKIGPASVSDLLLGSVNGNTPFVASEGAYPLAFFTSATERFRIGTSGQLGIGGANYGTSGQVLMSQGASSPPVWSTFATTTTYASGSGNYTIPTGARYVYVRLWGGGGSGGTYVSTSAAGGAGGAYKEEIYAVADLGGVGANVAYSVGAGGAAVAQGTAAGNPGGNTTFSSLTAHGGGGAVANSTGGTGAGYYGIGGFGGATSGQNSSDWGGAGGGASNSTTGGSAVYGGGGGGSRGNATATNGGPSIFGGRGGNCTLGVATGESGQVPGGGGASAGTTTGGTSGAGGAGRIEIYTW